MADTFDPYRKWLAIPAEEQPPHHYRLLAIPLFESDPDVISNAADGRMTQIKNYQTGPYAKVSQQILNQIAAAKICLLDPKKKAVYDRRLREKLQPADKPAEATEAAQPSEFDFSALTAATPASTPPIPKRKKSKSWVAPAVAGGALLVAGSVAAVVCMLPPQADQVASEAKKVPAPPVPEGEPSNLPKSAFDPAAASKDSSAKKSQPHAKPPAKASVQPVETKPSDPKPKPEEEADPKQEPEPKPEQTSEPVADEKPPGDHEEMAPAKKVAIPTDEQQQTVERQVREIFQAEFAAAKTAETRSALAGKLVEQAGKSGSDAAAPYVLCRLAAQQYAAAGNLDKAMTVLDTTAARYDTDVSRLKLEILNSLLGSRAKPAAIEPDIARGIYDAAMKLTESAAATGEVEAAVQFVRVVSTAAYRSRDPELERESGKKTREIDALKARFAAVQKALDTLETDPADADANLKAGQWLCLVRGQWDRGLPMLAKGSNKALAELARQDLGTHGEAKQQVAVADAWWNLGEKDPASKAALQDRARHWYQLAMPKLAGLDKARAEKRAGTPADNGNPAARPDANVLQEGNVALASNGATVGGSFDHPELLIDGHTQYDEKSGVAATKWPGVAIITLKQVYQLQLVRLRVYNRDPRIVHFILSTSTDGKNFTVAVDGSKLDLNWAMYDIKFPPRLAKVIKLDALYENHDEYFHVIQIEAYCTPPK